MKSKEREILGKDRYEKGRNAHYKIETIRKKERLKEKKRENT